MEYLFNQAVSFRAIDILAKPVTLLPPDGRFPKEHLAERLKKTEGTKPLDSVLNSPAALRIITRGNQRKDRRENVGTNPLPSLKG